LEDLVARKSDNFPLVLLGGGLGLWLLFHAIWTILFEDWLKHQLERLVGHTVAELMERFGSVGFPALASIAIIWFLYSYIKIHLKAEFAGPRAEAQRHYPSESATANATIFDPSWVRDVSLLDAIWRAHLGRWEAREVYPLENWEAKKPFYDLTDVIRQMAFEGQLPIWAKRRSSSLFEIVPPEFWRNHDLEAGYCILPQVPDTWVKVTHPLKIGEVPNARTMVWEDFMTSKEAVEKLWPKGEPG
jgi:hypothetical protein